MIVSEMEASFLNIFMEAAAKMADLTKSKLFVVFESSDGSRQIGGNRELVTTFQSGYLLPQPSDVVLGDSTEQFQPGSNLEADFGSISGFTEVNGHDENKSGTKRHRARDCSNDERKRYKPDCQTERISSRNELHEMKPALSMEERKRQNVSETSIATGIAYVHQDPDPDYDPKANEWHNVTTEECYSSNKPRARRRCGLCPPDSGKTYTLDNYRKHKAAIHDKKLSCPKCSKGFASLYYLNRHNCKMHENEEFLLKLV